MALMISMKTMREEKLILASPKRPFAFHAAYPFFRAAVLLLAAFLPPASLYAYFSRPSLPRIYSRACDLAYFFRYRRFILFLFRQLAPVASCRRLYYRRRMKPASKAVKRLRTGYFRRIYRLLKWQPYSFRRVS